MLLKLQSFFAMPFVDGFFSTPGNIKTIGIIANLPLCQLYIAQKLVLDAFYLMLNQFNINPNSIIFANHYRGVIVRMA
ncbi:hypothetical protein D3C72_1910750 [compost metagenome]